MLVSNSEKKILEFYEKKLGLGGWFFLVREQIRDFWPPYNVECPKTVSAALGGFQQVKSILYRQYRYTGILVFWADS